MNRRLILHFPEDNAIWSVGSGYGGNVLLGKKCLALRIASVLAQREKWFAEHMLILGIEEPNGRIQYIAAAFPSACGKTNLAMLLPPEGLKQKGYRIWTVGDDIAWMRVDTDGQLWAINPEMGFFGVVPGTNSADQPERDAHDQPRHDLHQRRAPARRHRLVGRPRRSAAGQGGGLAGQAMETGHDGQRRQADAVQPSQQPVHRAVHQLPDALVPLRPTPRRADLGDYLRRTPRDAWRRWCTRRSTGTTACYVGATMASERTAAQVGAVGEVRRDPMAMLPFCGYNMADYFGHWLDMGQRIQHQPKIFHVNWFRTDEQGQVPLAGLR